MERTLTFRDNRLVVELNDEQLKRLEEANNPTDGTKSPEIPLDISSLDDAQSGSILFYGGLILPLQIKSYYCSKCDKEHKDEPHARVSIDEIAGATCAYYCTQNERHYLFIHPIWKPEHIPVEFITTDYTGQYKKPTKESIEKILKEAEEHAKKNNVGDRIRTAQTWAEVIGHTIDPQRIETIEATAKDVYYRNFEENLPDFLGRMREYDDWGFNLNSDDVTGETSFGIYLQGSFNELFNALPHITIPDDPIVQRTLIHLLDCYKEMQDYQVSKLKEEMNELNERIKENKDESNNVEIIATTLLKKIGKDREILEKSELIPRP